MIRHSFTEENILTLLCSIKGKNFPFALLSAGSKVTYSSFHKVIAEAESDFTCDLSLMFPAGAFLPWIYNLSK